MANYGYMTITGSTMGAISAGCSGKESVGSKCQINRPDEIMVLSLTHNMANVGNSKYATHWPVFITKYLDKSSPLLAKALNSKEVLTCDIKYYRTSDDGQQELLYTIRLKETIIESITLDVPHADLQLEGSLQEVVALRYEDIYWTHHPGSTTEGVSWIRDQY
jgi:type VI secretion system Hcp family effector